MVASSPVRVLVVERPTPLRRVLLDILEAGGYAAFSADGASDVRASWASSPPDIALVSDHLQDGDSADVVRLLRSLRTADDLLVLVAGMCSSGTVAHLLMQAGARCIVEKPIVESELLVAVRWLDSVYLRPVDAA